MLAVVPSDTSPLPAAVLPLFTHISNQCVSSSGGDHHDDWPIKNDSSGERKRERVNGDPSQSCLSALWSALLSGSDRIASLSFPQASPSPWDSPPHSHSHHNTHAYTHTPLQPENHRLGFDGLHSPAEPRFLSRACDGKQRGDGDADGGRPAWQERL